MKKICVLGLGYIGLPTAATFATHGLQVLGVDVDEHILKTLNNGAVHIYEPGLETLVRAALKSGNLRVGREPEQAEAFIIAVPTPLCPDKTADMEAVRAAAHSIVPHLRPGNLVLLESTSPPRTTVDLVAPILENSGLKAGKDFHLAYSPERVLPGHILRELLENARVIGGVNRASAETGRDLYRVFVRGDIILTDSTTAEMVKLMENTYRDVNIAIANEFSRLADRFGVDIWEAVGMANLHPRVNILNPGTGVGGHCIGVDPWFLVGSAPDLALLIRTAREVNDAQPSFVMDLLRRALGGLQGKRVAVWGMAYKPDVDDFRESPAVEVVRLLVEAGAIVKVFDPYGTVDISGAQAVHSVEEGLADAESLLILVKHQQFTTLSAGQVAALTPARIVVDATGICNPVEWEPFGFDVFKLGLKTGQFGRDKTG